MRKLFIVIIILVIIGGAIYYLSLKGKPIFKTPESAPQTPEVTTPEKPTTEAPVTVDPIIKLKNDLIIQARAFIERYGSWSNQSNFENFEDLSPYMTDKLKAETQKLINQYRVSGIEHPEYYGLTTNVISLNLEDFAADERAEFSASVQQQETTNGTTKILYKTVKLVFLKEGIGWKADQIEIK